MVPFLFDELKVCSFHCSNFIVVKRDLMAKETPIKKLCLLNFEDVTNLLPVDQIDTKFTAKSAIKK